MAKIRYAVIAPKDGETLWFRELGKDEAPVSSAGETLLERDEPLDADSFVWDGAKKRPSKKTK